MKEVVNVYAEMEGKELLRLIMIGHSELQFSLKDDEVE